MKFLRRVCGALLAGLLVTGAGADQRTGPADPTDMPTITYTEAAFGFEMQIPAGWSYDQTRFQQFKGAIGLLRGRAPSGQRGLQVQIFRIQPVEIPATDDKPARVVFPEFEDWVEDFGRALADSADPIKTDEGEVALAWEPWKGTGDRVGALLTYATKIGAAQARTHTLCVPFDPGTVWVFVYTGTVRDEAGQRQLRQEFEHIARSLRIDYDPLEVERLGEAFERGRKLIRRLRAQGANVRLDDEEHYYEMRLGDKGIGYLRRRVSRETHEFTDPGAKFRDVREGLRVRERSWRFADDGTVRYTRFDLFSSFDGQNELIEKRTTQIPAPDVEPQRLLVKTNQAIRKENVLYASFTTNLDTSLPDPGKPLETGPVYLDLAWMRVAPGLLLSAEQKPHAFATYNPETRSLISQTVAPTGRKRVPGFDEPAYAFELREGLIDRASVMYTDARGTLVRLVAGGLVVQRVPRKEIERTYGERRDKARQRFSIELD